MPQFYTVAKAFQGKDKETGEVEVVNTKGGPAEKWLVQVENQPVNGWFSVLKKPGNEVKVGDQLYGVIEENNWGKPQFTRMQAPQDAPRAAQATKPAASAGAVEQKLDYIISILENARWFVDPQGTKKLGTEGPKDNVVDDIDDEDVDLSQLDI